MKESGKTAAGIAYVATDAKYRSVASPERVRVLPGKIFVEVECQMRIEAFLHLKHHCPRRCHSYHIFDTHTEFARQVDTWFNRKDHILFDNRLRFGGDDR